MLVGSIISNAAPIRYLLASEACNLHSSQHLYHGGFTLEDATGLTVKGDLDIHPVFATSLPTSHPIQVYHLKEYWKCQRPETRKASALAKHAMSSLVVRFFVVLVTGKGAACISSAIGTYQSRETWPLL
ncbi:unnamed protein product [Trifolium pratense]|uniref:Uncharacterized protein n=1 Tax=Trifolium pratense TaxID=57577 RepID=A0ACB0KV55_TRIPR|nr:unnamed protein product [Trifolium pratense]